MAFRVTIQRSGHVFECEPGQSVLAAGLDAGYVLPYNCRSGFCQTCKARIVEGQVGYKDELLPTYLSPEDRARGATLLCQARPLSDLVIDAREVLDLSGLTPRRSPARIRELELLAPDVARLKLRLPMNENILFAAGQHLALLFPDGEKRNYSIANACGSAGVSEVELHVRIYPGGLFSGQLFNGIKAGSLVQVELPLGTFFLREKSERPMIFIATGVGFAPIKAMLETIMAKDLCSKRPVHFYWGGRRRADLYFNALVQAWADATPGLSYTPLLSQPAEACEWGGATGHVQQHVLADHPDLSEHEIYACGAPTMIHQAKADMVARARADPARFFADEFSVAG